MPAVGEAAGEGEVAERSWSREVERDRAAGGLSGVNTGRGGWSLIRFILTPGKGSGGVELVE